MDLLERTASLIDALGKRGCVELWLKQRAHGLLVTLDELGRHVDARLYRQTKKSGSLRTGIRRIGLLRHGAW